MSVWQPDGSAAAQFVIRHSGGTAEVAIPPTSNAGWVTLGDFVFGAGFSAEIEVRQAAPASSLPLTVDALRCLRLGDD